MFLIILLILVIVFYPYKESFVDVPSIKKLHKDFDIIFKRNNNSIHKDYDNYMLLYNNLNK
jgi:hypothetical protein